MQGACTVSDERRTSKDDGTSPCCSRCEAAMKEVVYIAPVGHEPGLTAYECPNCGYVTSVLIRPLVDDHQSN